MKQKWKWAGHMPHMNYNWVHEVSLKIDKKGALRKGGERLALEGAFISRNGTQQAANDDA